MMHALHFEDFVVGDVYRPVGRTITEAEVMEFAGLSNDTNPVHTDAVFAAQSPFGERIAHGLLGLAASGGFLSRVGVIDGTAVALLGVEWAFKAPVRFGDTISAEITVADKREVSDVTRGIVKFSFRLLNQDDTLVQEGQHVFMILRRA
jgi:acyl dehydratase